MRWLLVAIGGTTIFLLFAGATSRCLHGAELLPADEPVDFRQQVAPIFAEHCAGCHGQQRQESNYRLDVREVALGTADLGEPPIVKGSAKGSPLLRYVSGTDPDGIVMPPQDAGQPLVPAQIATLRAWIDQGAAWPDEAAGAPQEKLTTNHWSFQPVRRPEAPNIRDAWVANPIDAFVLRKLSENHLTPSARADRRTLIRRLYLDLLGLPPTPDEVIAFQLDASPDAYGRLVNRLLGDRRYGERWATHWLDIVRFGESDGFETNQERPTAYYYRDYVIDALNNDKPYDQFIIEQLAGDALGADAATGFLVAGPYDIVKSPDINLTLMQRQDELADMVNTTGTTFVGLTVGCARCHNHKFDPVLQSDYYSMQAVFAGVQFGTRPLRTPQTMEVQQQLAHLQQEIQRHQSELAELRRIAASRKATTPTPGALRPAVSPVQNIERFAPVKARFVRFTIHQTNSSEPCLDELEIFATAESGVEAENVALATHGASATASGTLSGFDIHQLKHINDGQYGNQHSWISSTVGKGWVQIELPREYTIDRIQWGRDAEQVFSDRLAVDYTVEVAGEPDQWTVVASSADRQPSAGSSTNPLAFIQQLPPEQAQRAQQLQSAVDQLTAEVNRQASAIPTAYAGTFVEPGPTFRLHRGDPLAQREEVGPDALTVIGSLELAKDAPEQRRRLALAHWIARPDNPLTARVMVNRIWHYHFGKGIVATPSDFGANGAAPSHPQLLDWLAAGFVDQGWSIKQIHRLILLSNTYQQASFPRQDALRVDADNRLLWRFQPRRLEAEVIRDSILFVSGALNAHSGGPGFNVFDVQRETVHHYFPKESFGPNEWRRMVYMTKIRQERDGVFGTFDCPDGGQVVPKRTRSTTPLQALSLLNSSFMLQQAELLAARLQRETGDEPRPQVRRAFQLLFGREASELEITMSLELIQQNGIEAMCRALLNANEFLFLT